MNAENKEILDALLDIRDELANQNFKTNAGSTNRMSNVYKRRAGGSTLNDVLEMRKEHRQVKQEYKETKELLDLLSRINDLTDEEVKKLEDAKINVEELRKDSKKLEDNVGGLQDKLGDLSNKKYSTNFSNRVVAFNNVFSTIGRSLREIDNSLFGFVEPWAKADKAASKYAKTIAMTEAGMKSLRDTTIKSVVHGKIGINYNMSTEELLAAQQNYVQSVGRSLRIDASQQESLAAMSAVMGGDRTNELAAAFENFGVSLNGVAEHSGKMFATASKHGLSFEKYTSNVAKNIKIAQNYTFKNGLKGLESMAQKATALKLDMGQVAAFADKVSTIEGSIDVASKLQVLGGSFAAIADPLGMLSEGLMDMEGLTDRVIKMVGGLGSFNKQKGEIEVSAFNKQRIKAAAQAMGMDYSQLMESVNASAKREEIARQINASSNARGLDKDMQELIKNSATFNEKGEAGISINGEFKTLDKITNADREDLIKETQDQSADIKDIAKNLRSLVDAREGFTKQREAVQAKMTGWLGGIMKSVTTFAGSLTHLLGLIVVGKGIGTVASMLGGGLNIVDIFRGGKGAGGAARGGKGLFGRLFGRGGEKSVEQVGNTIGERSAKRAGVRAGSKLMEKAGRFGASSITKTSNIGAKLSSKGFTKLGGAVSRHAEKQALKHGMSGVAKQGGKRIAAKTATKIGTKMAAGVAKGGIAGIIGAAGNIATDMLVESGKIKKGGAGHTAMKVGSTALEGASLGATIGSIFPGIGTAIGAAVGAIGGAVVGSVKMAKIKREQALDNKLATMGLERKGDYGAWGLKRINNALDDGNISRRLRRKLERQGDTAILAQIDAKKKEKEEEKEKKKDRRAERWGKILGGGKSSIAKGMFSVEKAYFGGKAFGFGSEENEGDDKNKKDSRFNKAFENGALLPSFLNNGIFGFYNHLFKTGISNIKGVTEKGKNHDLNEMFEIAKKAENAKNNGANSENQKFNGGKLDLNISGTIKLEGANGKQVDITDNLIKDKDFIRELTKKITSQINRHQVGSDRQDNNNMAKVI